MPGGELADRPPVEFLVLDGHVAVQHEQIPWHARHFLSAWHRPRRGYAWPVQGLNAVYSYVPACRQGVS